MSRTRWLVLVGVVVVTAVALGVFIRGREEAAGVAGDALTALGRELEATTCLA